MRNRFRMDLGVGRLHADWKQIFSPRHLREDVLAGLTVACVALPLSLAIALASGVEPATGLFTAIVAGVGCALFGGTPLAVSGPAAAMVVLVASIVQDQGLGALLLVGIGCGILQLLTGVLGLGRIVRLVPTPVIQGFTAGIGAIILISQLPRALGLPPPEQSHVIEVLKHLANYVHDTHPVPLALALSALALVFGLPRVWPRLPAPLVAVIVPSVAAAALGLDVQTIGHIPRFFPAPSMPDLHGVNVLAVVGATLMVYALASLETLLSSSVVDKIAGTRHDPDQELIGQGMGNLLTAAIGGIPVTGVIVRSALNVQAGAKTRRSSIIHSLALLSIVLVFAPLIEKIPVAVLSGVLLSVALRMLNPAEMIGLWKLSKAETAAYAVTFAVMVSVDLVVGVQAGMAASLAILAIRLGRSRTRFHRPYHDGPYRLALEGPLTFMSSLELSRLYEQAESVDKKAGAVFDLTRVAAVDVSASEQLVGIFQALRKRGVRVALQGPSPALAQGLAAADPTGELARCFAFTESDVHAILGRDGSGPAPDRLKYGVVRFQRELRKIYQPLFERLSDSQSPHTLFVTCSDSRINPNLITSTDPGELFVVRNVGNIIPPYESGGPACSELAALEFAVSVLGVSNVVICAHSGCGAMKAICSGAAFHEHPGLRAWLGRVRAGLPGVVVGQEADELARRNVVEQLDHVANYPGIAQRLRDGGLQLHAWFYDIGSGSLEEWNPRKKAFEPLGSAEALPAAGE